MNELKFPVFSKYTFLLTGLDKIFKVIDLLVETTDIDDRQRDLVEFMKHEKDALEKFILGERSI